jgi:hypothetical protein
MGLFEEGMLAIEEHQATVLVRVILNVSAQDALKLNARQFAQSTTFDSAGIYKIWRACDENLIT